MTRRQFLAATAAASAPANAAGLPKSPAEYPLYRAQGTPRQLGRQHGEQAAAKIKGHLEYMAASSKMPLLPMRRRALRFQPLFERYCPHLLEEIRGLAEGCGIPLADALAVNIRGELGHAPQEGCTTYAIKQREILIGQNSDITPDIPPLAYVLHLKPLNKPEILTWTFGGMIGYHGINSEGVGHFANSLGGGPAGTFALPHYPVKRLMLECRKIGEVIDLLKTAPLASNGNYVLCDAKQILDIEATTAGPEILRDEGKGFLAHTNHFMCARYANKQNFSQSWQDSFPRLDRMNSLLASRYGSLTVEDLKKYLSDHSGHPASICRHDRESSTVASLIAEPARRLMHVAVANPCENHYATYSM